MPIKLLDIVFLTPDSSDEVAAQIRDLSPKFDAISQLYPEQQGQFANRVLETARANHSNSPRKDIFELGALKAQANPVLEGDVDAAFWVRQAGVRNGAIDGLNPSHDLRYLIDVKP